MPVLSAARRTDFSHLEEWEIPEPQGEDWGKLDLALRGAIRHLDDRPSRGLGMTDKEVGKSIVAIDVAAYCDQATFEAVFNITQEMFPSAALFVELETEPDDPTDAFIIFNVAAKGSPSELVRLRCQWHRSIASILPLDHSLLFRLSIDPR